MQQITGIWRWITINWKILAIIALWTLILSILFQKCEDRKPKKYSPVEVPEQNTDSLKQKLEQVGRLLEAANRKADSLEDLFVRQQIELAVANQEQQRIVDRYEAKIAKLDTSAAIDECNALAATVRVQGVRLERFESTTLALLEVIAKKDSLWQEDLRISREALAKTELERDMLRSALEQEQLWNKVATEDYNKLLRDRKRGKTKERIMAAVAGAALAAFLLK